MADMVFDKILLGRQSAVATAVAVSAIYPGKATAPDLDRGYRNPDEDWGRMTDQQPGRGSFGVRGASLSIAADFRFQDAMHPFEMHYAAISGGTATGGIYTYTADETSDTLKSYTIQLGSNDASDQWQFTGARVNTLTYGFDALSAPGNAPWTFDMGLLAVDRSITAFGTAAVAPTTLETAEGHTTIIKRGSPSTAFASLSELANSLIMFRATSNRNLVLRPYGGTVDYATAYGHSAKPGITFDAMIAIGTAAKTAIHDAFNASGSPVTEERWRVITTGTSGTATFDQRVRYQVVGRGEREGESVYAITGSMVYDATLGGRVQIALNNGGTTIP